MSKLKVTSLNSWSRDDFTRKSNQNLVTYWHLV